MSRKTELLADLNRIGKELGGAHLTRDARAATFSTFARVISEQGFGIARASQIGGRHLSSYVVGRLEKGISRRSLANELSHLRAVLNHEGKQGLARNPEYSNARLGIDGGSRAGTKTPLSDQQINQFQQKMEALGRTGIGATLELQRALGLRETEAIRGGSVDVLDRWGRELARDGSLRVIEGTKGGRPREVRPVNLARAVQAVRAAQEILKSLGIGRLVQRADGSATTGLKQARGVYRNICHREQIQSHAARYAFAREQLSGYTDQGFSKQESQAATSIDLGHGDGRGRFVASVYAREEWTPR